MMFVIQQTVTIPVEGKKRPKIAVEYLQSVDDCGSLGLDLEWTEDLQQAHLFNSGDSAQAVFTRGHLRTTKHGRVAPGFKYAIKQVKIVLV